MAQTAHPASALVVGRDPGHDVLRDHLPDHRGRHMAQQFKGELDAVSVVHMLAVGTEVPGSAGYVAVERVSGTLQGRAGTFFMQHSGIMDRGTPSLSLQVVPDSGTGELKGL